MRTHMRQSTATKLAGDQMCPPCDQSHIHEMLAHDISVRKAMDLITDSAKQVAKAKLEEGSEDEEDK